MWICTLWIYSLSTLENTDENKIFFCSFTKSIWAKFSTWCFEHSGEITCSLIVNPNCTDESWVGRSKCMWIYTYIYTSKTFCPEDITNQRMDCTKLDYTILAQWTLEWGRLGIKIYNRIQYQFLYIKINFYIEAHSKPQPNLYSKKFGIFFLNSFFLNYYGFCDYKDCLSSKLRYSINNLSSTYFHVYHNTFVLRWCKFNPKKKIY